MLSVKIFTSSGAAEKYYSHGDYYGSEGEGTWLGEGAKDFGLKGRFFAKNNKEFSNLLNGIAPDGTVLGRNTKEGREHNPGTDLTFSVPKSFSIQMMLYANADEKKNMEKAVMNSVSKTLSFIKKEGYVFARLGAQGKEREKLESLIFATFMHTTNRNLEPQVHVHSFLANIAKCKDGKYRSTNIDNLLQNNKYFGQIFRNELAIESKKIGLEISPTILSDGSSSFELSNIHPKLIDAFSTRRKEILKLCEQYGVTTKEGRDKIVINSRKAKKLVTEEQLSKAWNEIEQKTVSEIASNTEQPKNEERSMSVQELKLSEAENNNTALTIRDVAKLCIEDVSYNTSVFTRDELLQKSLKYSIGAFGIEDLKKEITNLEKSGELIGKNDLFTTKSLLTKEKQILKLAEKSLDSSKQIIKPRKFEPQCQKFEAREIAKSSHFKMNDQQKFALKHILTSKDKIITMEGLPGVGKSTVLNGVRDISGKKIISLLGFGEKFQGSAPTASAAKTLSESAKIESQTLHSFLGKYQGYIEGRGQSSLRHFKNEYKNTVIFLDEASLVSTNIMHKLLTLQEKFGFRLVLTGDTKQLGSVEAGKPFEQMLGIIKPVKLQEIVRQRQADHKQAVSKASLGKISETFAIHDKNIKTSKSLADDAAKNYLAKSQSQRDNTLLISPTRALRDEINIKIRNGLGLTGKAIDFTALRQKNMTKADYNFAPSFAAGDIIKFNTGYKNGIHKDDYLKVKSVNSITNSLVLDKNGKDIYFAIRKNTDYSSKIEVFQNQNLKLQEGLKIIFTKNNKEHGLINSETAVVEKIDKNNIILKVERDNSRSIPKEQLKHIDYGYCVTVHSAQGKTYENTIAAISNNKTINSQKMWLVAISRHKSEFTVLVEDKDKLQRNIYVNKEMSKSAIELDTQVNK